MQSPSGKHRELLKPQRLIVVELTDVVPRRETSRANVFVTTTTMPFGEESAFLTRLKKSRKRLAPHFVKVRDDLSTLDWFTDLNSRNGAKTQLCTRLAAEGYCVNPNPEAKHSIYVVKLKRSAWAKDERQPIYVGESSYEPVERIAHHLGGVRSARKVRNHFDRRCEELEPNHLALYSRYDAIAEETKWGLKLLKDGYKVFGPQGLPKE